MYAPLLIAGLAASLGGTGMQIAGNAKAQSALNATRAQEVQQQAGFQKTAQHTVNDSLAQSTMPVAKQQMASGTADRLTAFQALQAAGAPLTDQSGQPTTTNKVIGGTPTEQAAARAGTAGTAWSNLAANAQATEGGYGDWQTAQNVKNAKATGNLSAIGTQASDAASIYPIEQNVALQKGDQLSGWGQFLQTLGSLSMMGASIAAPAAPAAMTAAQGSSFMAGAGPVSAGYAAANPWSTIAAQGANSPITGWASLY